MDMHTMAGFHHWKHITAFWGVFFSNSVSAVALPVISILAVIFFDEEMDCIKVVAMFLALWGFLSYVYQHYLDDQESKSEHTNINVNNDA